MIASLTIKAVLNETVSLFNTKQVSYNTPTKTLTVFLETLVIIAYMITEIGYIFFWVISEKPYELYTVLNIGKWDGRLSRF